MTIAILLYLLIGMVLSLLWLVGTLEDEDKYSKVSEVIKGFIKVVFLWLPLLIIQIFLND